MGTPTVTGPAARPLTGVLLMLGAFTFLPIIDSMAKVLLQYYPVLQVVWARVFFHLAVMAPVMLLLVERRHWWPHQPKLQLLRSCFMILVTVLFFAALKTMPLVDAIALLFIAPMVVTALSPWLLGERVGPRRCAAVVVGFAGAMMVVRPTFDQVPWEAVLALGAGVSFGLLLITTRKLSGGDDPLVTLTYTALIGGVATTVALPTVWVTPTAFHLFLMAATGLVAVAGHLMVIKAMAHADASLLAPITYQELVVTTGLGYLLFDELPEPLTWAGVATIIASGFYITLRERQIN
ncbi:MAG: DMT family transporter [Alphaproteobacteria bacterium]